jgi:hypothetical protein
MATYEEAVAAAQRLTTALSSYPSLLNDLNVIKEWSTNARQKLLYAGIVRDKVRNYVIRLREELSIDSVDQAVEDLNQSIVALVGTDLAGNIVDFDLEIEDALAHFALTHPVTAATVRAYIDTLRSS